MQMTSKIPPSYHSSTRDNLAIFHFSFFKNQYWCGVTPNEGLLQSIKGHPLEGWIDV